MAEETQSITTRHDAETDPALWWRQAVVYQVYPRSFQDTTGSGLGDINGITGRIPYLRQLGVDAIWLSPFYPSELADGGYDVADYRDVDPKLGSMDDFDRLAAAAHAADIKVVVDIVPNHSSHLHPWFRQALADGPGSPARDRYIFRDGKGPNGDEPPTRCRTISEVRHGRAWTTANGTCTCSPRSSPTGTGGTRTCAPISLRRCVSGAITAWTGSASMWRTGSPRTSTATTSTTTW